MGFPVARLFGIEIRVPYGWVVILALVAVIAVGEVNAVEPQVETVTAWIIGLLVSFGFFLSSLVHDLAHALVARRRGVEVKAIAISFFGGATPIDFAAKDPKDDVAIAASGPIASIVIGVIFFGLVIAATALGDKFDQAAGVLSVFVFVNLVLGFVNLVPAYPLDGGRIVRDLTWRKSGSEAAGWRAAARTGRAAGMVIIGVGISYLVLGGDLTGVMIALAGYFLVLSANSVRDRVRLDDVVGDHLVDEAMEHTTTTVSPTLTVDTFAAQLLDGESPVSAVPVARGDAIVGLLGVAQVRRLRRGQWATTRVEDVMAKPPKLTFLAPTDSLRSGLERIAKTGLDGLPVMDDGHLAGVLTRRGIARFVSARNTPAAAGAPPLPPVPPLDPPSAPPGDSAS
jgi:Zn-dependent protease/predicted transcriptional regulator